MDDGSRDATQKERRLNGRQYLTPISAAGTYGVLGTRGQVPMIFLVDYKKENTRRVSLEKLNNLFKAGGCIENKTFFPDSSFGNSLSIVDTRQNQKPPLFFSWPPMPLEIKLLPPG